MFLKKEIVAALCSFPFNKHVYYIFLKNPFLFIESICIVVTLITRLNEELLRNVTIHDPMISDHLAVFCNLSLKKPQLRKKVISTRKLRSLDIDSFREDVRNSSLVEEEPIDLDSAVAQYDNGIRLLLDQYASAKKRLVAIRPFAPWYSPILATEKQKRRRLERKWRKTYLQSDREAYQYQCCVVN